MVTILISFFMFVLIVVSGLMSVIILMQKPSANAGMGAALGGGAAESVFGGEASGQLLKFTVRIAVAFFLLSFLLYLGFIATNRPAASSNDVLPAVLPDKSAPAAPATAAAVPASTSPPTMAPISTKTTAPTGTSSAPSPTSVPATSSSSSK